MFTKVQKRWRWSHFLNKILIVDPSEFDCIEISYILKRNGYTHIFSASTAEHALELFNKNTPDLILTNVDLPDMDGFNLCERINQLSKSHSKVVLMTDHVSAINLSRAKQCGALDFMVKTKNFEYLPRVVHDLITS